MLRIAIVESDQQTGKEVQAFVKQYAAEKGLSIATEPYSRAEIFLAAYRPVYEIVFLGTGGPGLNGMEAARKLRAIDRNVVLVFVTELARYAIQGYEVDALDVLLKPLNYYAFSVKMDRAIQRVRQRTGETITLQAADGIHRLEIRQVYYLETRNRMLYYHTAAGTFQVRGSLQSARQMLAAHSFAKCNQCYLVNLQHVTDVQDSFVVVAGSRLEISRRSRKNFLDAVVGYIGGM